MMKINYAYRLVVPLIRRCGFLLVPFLMAISAMAYPQHKLTVTLENAELARLFRIIQQETNYQFIYSNEDLAGAPLITVRAVDEPIERILAESFKGTGLNYRISDHTIIVSKPAVPLQREVTGRVTSVQGEPLEAVTVTVKGTAVATTSDAQGNYRISVPPDGQVLVFTSIGFEPLEIPLNARALVNAQMQEVVSDLDEVVVIGYGTQTRKQVTGAISSVSGSQITKQPVLTPAQGLQGLTPGVQIIASGQPGTQPRVQIRGLNTILTNENPLYVVDGVLTEDITNVNNADVVSVDVLKDGAAAIYGSRAANGVVLITTRQGATGKVKVNLDTYTGFRQMINKVQMADSRFYAIYTDEARAYDNQAPIFDPDTIVHNTDWYDEISRNGLLQNHNVTLSGGSEDVKYLFSAGYFGDEGILKGADFSRISLRSNNEFRIADFLKFGNVLNVAVSKTDNKPNSAFTDAYRAGSSAPVRFPDGNYGFISELSVANPVAALELANDFSNSQRYQGNVFGELTLLPGLTFRSAWGFDRTTGDSQNYIPVYGYGIFTHPISELFVGENKRFYWVWDNILNYNRQFGDHSLSAMVGHTAERDRGRGLIIRATNVPAERHLWYISQGDPTVTVDPADVTGFNLQRRSLFGRVNYSFLDKYNLSGVLRRDGSSAFPENQQWGTFYSVAGSWIISSERFMENASWIDYLKLRAGYAKLGNDGISRLVNNELSQLLAITQTSPYGFPNGLASGITFDQIKDALATWEATEGVDAGLEFGLLDSRLTGEVSYYNKVTNAYIRVPTPPFVDPNGILSPAADVRNRGVELALGWNERNNEQFNYRLGFNVTLNRNNVDEVRGGIDLPEGGLGNGEITTRTIEGQPIGSFWVYQVDGIYQTQAEIDGSPHFEGTMPGDFRYTDINNDGSLDSRDRIYVGSYQPRFYYGVNGGFTWKQLDFSIDCYGNAGNKVYNGKKGVRFGNDNIEASREARWTPSNTNTTEPRASNSIPKPSTYFVESGSFFRINNITLGYTLPQSFISRAAMSNARIFVTAQNPVISKRFSGFSPELPGSNAMNSGIELSVYPTLATYMVGVNINFK